MDIHVDTKEFDEECNAISREYSKGSSISPASDFSDSSLWDKDDKDDSSSVKSVSPPYAVSKLEASFYYSGLSGHNRAPRS